MVPLGGQAAYGEEHLGRGHIDSAARIDTFMGKSNVKTSASVLVEFAMPEARRDLRLVGGLVGTEPGVAIDAVDGSGRVGDEIRSAACEMGVERLDEGYHRRLDGGLEQLLTGSKPLAPVVLFQLAEESERFLGKA